MRLRHESAAPMGHPRGLTVQGRLDDPLARGLIVLRLAPPSRGDLPNLPDALLATLDGTTGADDAADDAARGGNAIKAAAAGATTTCTRCTAPRHRNWIGRRALIHFGGRHLFLQ